MTSSPETTRSNHHVCLFDRTCWQEMWDCGMPLRIYRKNGAYYTVPILKRVARWRMNRIWQKCRTGRSDLDRK